MQMTAKLNGECNSGLPIPILKFPLIVQSQSESDKFYYNPNLLNRIHHSFKHSIGSAYPDSGFFVGVGDTKTIEDDHYVLHPFKLDFGRLSLENAVNDSFVITNNDDDSDLPYFFRVMYVLENVTSVSLSRSSENHSKPKKHTDKITQLSKEAFGNLSFSYKNQNFSIQNSAFPMLKFLHQPALKKLFLMFYSSDQSNLNQGVINKNNSAINYIDSLGGFKNYFVQFSSS